MNLNELVARANVSPPVETIPREGPPCTLNIQETFQEFLARLDDGSLPNLVIDRRDRDEDKFLERFLSDASKDLRVICKDAGIKQDNDWDFPTAFRSRFVDETGSGDRYIHPGNTMLKVPDTLLRTWSDPTNLRTQYLSQMCYTDSSSVNNIKYVAYLSPPDSSLTPVI